MCKVLSAWHLALSARLMALSNRVNWAWVMHQLSTNRAQWSCCLHFQIQSATLNKLSVPSCRLQYIYMHACNVILCSNACSMWCAVYCNSLVSIQNVKYVHNNYRVYMPFALDGTHWYIYKVNCSSLSHVSTQHLQRTVELLLTTAVYLLLHTGLVLFSTVHTSALMTEPLI